MNIEKEYVEGLLRKIERLQSERDCHHVWQDKACKLLEAAIKQDQVIDTVLEYSIDDFLNETPQQCLRDVKAEAVLKFAKYIDETGELNFGDSNLILSEAFSYSESLRQGGAE